MKLEKMQKREAERREGGVGFGGEGEGCEGELVGNGEAELVDGGKDFSDIWVCGGSLGELRSG